MQKTCRVFYVVLNNLLGTWINVFDYNLSTYLTFMALSDLLVDSLSSILIFKLKIPV